MASPTQVREFSGYKVWRRGRLSLFIPSPYLVALTEPARAIEEAAPLCGLSHCSARAFTGTHGGLYTLCPQHRDGLVPMGIGGSENYTDSTPLEEPAPVFKWQVTNLEDLVAGYLNGMLVTVVDWPDYDHRVYWAGVKMHPTGLWMIVSPEDLFIL